MHDTILTFDDIITGAVDELAHEQRDIDTAMDALRERQQKLFAVKRDVMTHLNDKSAVINTRDSLELFMETAIREMSYTLMDEPEISSVATMLRPAPSVSLSEISDLAYRFMDIDRYIVEVVMINTMIRLILSRR